MNHTKKSLFLVVNVDWFFLSHRLPIALAARQQGYDVAILTKDTGKRNEIESYGLRFINIPFERSGSSPLHELRCILKLRKIYKSQKPDIIHHITLKASLLGCFAAKLAKNKNVINAISGFGYNFTDGRNLGLKQRIIRKFMNMAFRNKHSHFILQNPDDINHILLQKYTNSSKVHLIKGSGVDLSGFSFKKEVVKDKVRIVLIARMLYDKGILEYIESAKKIKDKVSSKAEFMLVGDCDKHNLASISKENLLKEIDNCYIKWIGFQNDIFEIIKMSDIMVLPSYREGLPKSLIEACAVGRPIITTDAIGCRECVIDGYNGFLVPVKDTDILAEKMEMLINNKEERERMGVNSRTFAEKNFSIEMVIEKHLSIYKELIG